LALLTTIKPCSLFHTEKGKSKEVSEEEEEEEIERYGEPLGTVSNRGFSDGS
jgi:hypothetical protein